jgi:uncharacterized oxidoreductase
MATTDDVLIQSEALQDLVTEIFEHVECSSEESRRIAANLVEANLTGHDSHGVIRTGRYVEWLKAGIQLADQSLDVLVDQPTLMLVDGKYGMGQTVGTLAVQLGIERAREHGLSIVALRKAGHLGRIGAFAEQAAMAGLVSMHIVNVASSQLVAPFGSRDRRMGTNPYAFGVPRPDGLPPVIHDFATSIVAEGKTMVALHGGPAVPDNALVGPDGITGDPSVLYDIQPGKRPNPSGGPGALRAMGEHKGSGLSVMCELLAGALTGTGTAGPGDIRFANGMLSVYIDPARIDPDDSFAASVTDYIDWFLEATPLDADEPVRLPGDRERERRADREANGLQLPHQLWQNIATAAASVGITQTRIDDAATSL